MDTVWSFRTRQFTVALQVAPEESDPADSFSEPEDIEAVRSGAVEWFYCRVIVRKNGYLVGADSLGGCAYKTIREFYTSHRDSDPLNRNSSVMRAKRGANVVMCHYFPGMVSEAVAAARKTCGLTKKGV